MAMEGTEQGAVKSSEEPRIDSIAAEESGLDKAKSLLETLCKHLDDDKKTKDGFDAEKFRARLWEMFSPSKTDIAYLESAAFRNVLRLADSRCEKMPSKARVHIKEVLDNLILNPPKSEEEQRKVLENKRRKRKAKTGSSQTILEELYIALSDVTKRVREAELREEEDTDDEDEPMESNYVYIDRLKKRAVSIFKKIQEMEGMKNTTLAESAKPIIVKATSYPEINRSTARMATRCIKKNMIPDFQDVLAVVTRVNASESLGMSQEKKREVAREAFQEIILRIKKRRAKDTQNNIESLEVELLLQNETAPEENTELSEKFKRNHEVAEENIKKVIDEFADKQGSGSRENANGNGEKDENGNGDSKTDPQFRIVNVEGHSSNQKAGGKSAESDGTESEIDERYLNSESEHETDNEIQTVRDDSIKNEDHLLSGSSDEDRKPARRVKRMKPNGTPPAAKVIELSDSESEEVVRLPPNITMTALPSKPIDDVIEISD